MSVFSRWLKPAVLAATVVVAGSLSAAAPVQAQDVTVLRGSPSQPSASPPYSSIDCSNPYYAQYCQGDGFGNDSSYSYGDDYPYDGYGLPLGVGARRGGFHRGGFHGRFHASSRGGGSHRRVHASGFHGGGFHGGGFHGDGFHGGGFSGGGFSGGGHR